MTREYFRMECDCNMYEEGMLILDSGVELLWKHGFKTDDFIIFKYCPWCGKKLIKVPIPVTMSHREAQKRSYKLHMHMPADNSFWKIFFDDNPFIPQRDLRHGNQDNKDNREK